MKNIKFNINDLVIRIDTESNKIPILYVIKEKQEKLFLCENILDENDKIHLYPFEISLVKNHKKRILSMISKYSEVLNA